MEVEEVDESREEEEERGCKEVRGEERRGYEKVVRCIYIFLFIYLFFFDTSLALLSLKYQIGGIINLLV